MSIRPRTLTSLRRHRNPSLAAAAHDLAARLDESDAKALQAAIAALQDIPDDPGFALIGRADVLGGGG